VFGLGRFWSVDSLDETSGAESNHILEFSDEFVSGRAKFLCNAKCKDILEFSDEFASSGVKFLSSVTR